ncbi:MAG: hypothetical protein ACLGSA_15365 [Acidobacteriota bacterium]
MRVFAALYLASALMLASIGAASAQPGNPNLAGQWTRMPKDARIAYMTGAAAGARAFAETQPNTPMPVNIRVDQAVTNMDHLAPDPMNRNQTMMAVAYRALMAAQDKGIQFRETGAPIRDVHFDDQILFQTPWLYPINLDSLIPVSSPGANATFGDSWRSAAQHQKQFFVQGFGDMAADQCLTRYGDTPAGERCVKPLLPMPVDLVIATMDDIYRDHRFSAQGYDLVIRAALLKMTEGDWQAVLSKK